MKKRVLLQSTFIVILSILGSLLYFFGSSILENAHLSYIRYQARNVVTLLNTRGGGGTGFVVKGKSKKLYILTNNHICDSANNNPLIAIYRGDKYILPVIKSYPLNDLCVVEAPKTVNDYFKIASNTDMGERAYVIGHPLLEPITVSQGELSSLVRIQIQVGVNINPKDCSGLTYETIDLSENLMAALLGVNNVCVRNLEANGSTINILPGNSGSPTVNIYGNVIGVVFAAVESGVHSYHVPLDYIQDFLSTL